MAAYFMLPVSENIVKKVSLLFEILKGVEIWKVFFGIRIRLKTNAVKMIIGH
jgi:hypothetical protein